VTRRGYRRRAIAHPERVCRPCQRRPSIAGPRDPGPLPSTALPLRSRDHPRRVHHERGWPL